MKFTLAALSVAGALVLGGCASTPPQSSALQTQWPAHLPARVDLSGTTPFIAQDDYECGPAALAMLLQTAGKRVTVEQLKPQVFLPGRKGSLQTEMLVAVRRQGLPAYALLPRLDALLSELAAGHPVVVFQNLSLPIYPVWHYAVAVGYDRERQTVLLHSGTTRRQEVELSVFERTWARGDYWSMTALPLDQVPASLDGAQTGAALSALERLNAPAARRGYATALTRWPGEPVLLMGAGNTAYAAGDKSAAAKYYGRITDLRPDLPDAWNNLAQVLLEQGNRPKAAQAIQRAVELGGPRVDQYKALQRKINNGI